MSAAVLQWPRRPEPRSGWTNDELAELYRVEHALRQAAFAVDTDCGVSDEGDPWFVFCHREGGVVVHIARIGELYHLYCVTLPNPLVGSSFAALTKSYIASLPTPPSTRSGVVVAHPSALLSLLVAAAVFSVDALMQHSAHAAESPVAHQRDFVFGGPGAGGAPNAGLVQAFSATLEAAVWRDRADDPETDAWRTVEQAALGFAALYEANLIAEPLGKAAPSAPMALAQTILAPLAEEASQVGAADCGQTQICGNSSNEENVGPPSSVGEFVPSAPQPTPMLVDIQLAPISDAEEVFTIRQTDVSPGRFGLSAGAKTATSAGDPPPAAYQDENAQGPVLAGARDLSVVLTAAGASLDLAQDAGFLQLVLSGQGELAVFHAEFAKSIDILKGAAADLDLLYDATSSSIQKLLLGGATEVTLAVESPQPASLVVNSQGARANHLDILDSTPGQGADLNIKIVGDESVILQESAETFAASHLNASALTGNLTVGIDLGDGPASVTNLSVGSGNFVVTPQDSIALENLGNNTTIELGVELSSAIFGFANDVRETGSIALTLDLGISGQTAPLSIGLINAAGVDELSITSLGSNNAVQTIVDPALTDLRLTGSGALEIGAILGIGAAHHQNVLIDASGLAGFLTLDASAIGDLTAGGRQVSIVLGAGGGAVTDTNVTEALTVTMDAGDGLLNIADGATHIAVAGLNATDQVNVGEATTVDAVINGRGANQTQQASIDGANTLLSAATTAATLAGSTIAHQAVLFSYHGDSYVFVDAIGDHVFNSSFDAIVKLTGVVSPTDLAGVFHSS